MQQPDSNKSYYLDIWTEMLWTFLGWPPSTVMEWLRDTFDLTKLDDPYDLYYHQTPQYWIRGLLVPAPLREALSNHELGVLQERILGAFADEHYYDFPRGTDWRPFRQRVNDILAEFGGMLPQVSDI